MSAAFSFCVARPLSGASPRFVRIASWRLDAPVERVWEVLSDVESWPRWWPDLLAVRRVREGRDDGVGALNEFTWRSRLGYRLRLMVETRSVRRPEVIEGVALGDVSGHGLWLLDASSAGSVQVTYRWDVRLERTWMRFAMPLLRPLFSWSHAAVMRRGARGLAGALGCSMLDFHDYAALPQWPTDAETGPRRRAHHE